MNDKKQTWAIDIDVGSKDGTLKGYCDDCGRNVDEICEYWGTEANASTTFCAFKVPRTPPGPRRYKRMIDNYPDCECGDDGDKGDGR